MIIFWLKSDRDAKTSAIFDIFTVLMVGFNQILKRKYWATFSEKEQKQLFQLLLFWGAIAVFGIFLLTVHLLLPDFEGCFICDIVLVAVSLMAILCALNGKRDCSINVIFSVAILVYAYYISDLNVHSFPIETVYYSTWWLMAGLVFLYYFSQFQTKIIFYFFISLITIGFQLYKAGHLVDSFSYYSPVLINPLLIFTLFFLVTYYLQKKLLLAIEKLEQGILSNAESVNKVLQNSSFLIARIVAERDEDKNVVKLVVEKVNHAFESGFKLNLHEIQGQDADYIFKLIFKGQFDVNKIVLFNKRKVSEFQDQKRDKWFKVHLVNPKYNSYYIVFEDITEVKKQISALETSKKRYKVLLEAIPDIFFVIDKDGIYEDFVIKESDLFKMDDVNIIGSSIFDVGFPDNMAKKIYSCIQYCVKNNSIETIEYSLNTPKGTFLFEMRLAKLNAHSVISVARDITKRKTAEFGLEKALKRAEESDKLKSAFLSNVSHEIRTPMNIITNFTRMLADDGLESMERLELTEAITQNGQQLLNMIDNTIHLSKIETEDVNVKCNFCKINMLLRDIYNVYLPNLPDSRDLRMKLNVDVANPGFGFATDEDLLRGALTILVDNAVKYTPSGLVTLGYEMIRNDHVKFIVSDTGIGIPRDDFENIFSRFYRIQNPINQSTSGSGIGLPIAQHYISLLGGELEFDSVLNEGSKFWFTLQFKEGHGYMKLLN